MSSQETEDDEFIIETKGVRVNFGDFWALKGIDIKVRRGSYECTNFEIFWLFNK